MIGLAGRYAARGQHQVVVHRRGRDRALKLLGIVRQNAEIGRGRAKALDQTSEEIAVGIEQRGLRSRRARLDDLVAGREHRDPYRPSYGERGEPDRGRERDMLLGEAPARRQHHGAGAQILARKPSVGANLKARRDDHTPALDAAILLHENGVSAEWHRRAGEDADRFAGRERMRGGVAGSHAVTHREARLLGGIEIGVADRVAIDRGIVERRQAERRHDIARDHAPARGEQRHRLDLGNRFHALRDQTLGFRDREKRPREREAIVGQLRHQAAPARANAAPSGTARLIRISTIRSTSSSSMTGTGASLSATSDAIATMAGSPKASSGMPTAARCTSSFGCGAPL